MCKRHWKAHSPRVDWGPTAPCRGVSTTHRHSRRALEGEDAAAPGENAPQRLTAPEDGLTAGQEASLSWGYSVAIVIVMWVSLGPAITKTVVVRWSFVVTRALWAPKSASDSILQPLLPRPVL